MSVLPLVITGYELISKTPGLHQGGFDLISKQSIPLSCALNLSANMRFIMPLLLSIRLQRNVQDHLIRCLKSQLCLVKSLCIYFLHHIGSNLNLIING